MKRWLARIALCLPLTAAMPVHALEAGAPAPTLSAPDRAHRDVTLAQFKGKVVYVDFWASWCAPCREAMPALDTLYQRYRERGLVVLGVNVDTDRLPAQRMLEHYQPTFPVLFDPQGKWPEAFGLKDMPSGYLIDAQGVIRFVKRGYRPQDLLSLETTIKAALGEPQ
ncbi:MAG: TlpA family protein disulfide reductase [Nevskiaceae bacterium]|nr:MAG: TlpA family protein disulfide reductase [Nevskiaceae bacterium]